MSRPEHPAYGLLRPVTETASVLLCDNPGLMTLDGTNTWVLREPGARRSVVVDPGPPDEAHLAAVAEALLERETLSAEDIRMMARGEKLPPLSRGGSSITPPALPVIPSPAHEPRRNPHDPAYPETVRSCLHVILGEEWEHHRFAVLDLDAIMSR